MKGRRFPWWVVLALALVVALLAGSGVFSSTPPTAAQRALSIESDIRCPSCEDLSVADSSAETAVTVRAAIRQQIAEGRTDQQIKASLVDEYGSAIVLVPPAAGWSLLIWVLPAGGGVLAVGLLVVVLARRRRLASQDPDQAAAELEAEVGADAGQLIERRRFLERSLADAEAEYRAGDMSEEDLQLLCRRDTARLSAVEARLAQLAGSVNSEARLAGSDDLVGSAVTAAGSVNSEAGSAGPATGTLPGASAEPGDAPETPEGSMPSRRVPRPRSRRQRWLLGGGVSALGVAAVLVVALFATNRLPGQTVTGSINVTSQQQVTQSLDEAAAYENLGQLAQATQLYQSVLDADPNQEVAMAQLGWIEYQTGQSSRNTSLMNQGRAKLERAVQLKPGDYAAHLYLGSVLIGLDDNAAGAVAQYQQFLADNPPATIVQQAAAVIRNAYQQAGVPLPPQVPAG
jgi:cytochrome c-type biogenesis protein CcmH